MSGNECDLCEKEIKNRNPNFSKVDNELLVDEMIDGAQIFQLTSGKECCEK